MTDKEGSPHKAGNGHKLAGWVRHHCIAPWVSAQLVLPLPAFLLVWGIIL